tara:strand:+ start:373 stop:1119 length:747 start_codon:yes stop_codon:yes gene_type:complete
MIINITNISELLNNKLTVQQRGLLITMLLIKDTKPEYTLAKLKSTIKIKEYHQDLIILHKAGYIKWSNYNSVVKSEAEKRDDPNVFEVINFMNKLYGRNFQADSKYATKELRARLTEHSVEDIKQVVANRYVEWKDDAVMEKHLNPTTIFRPSKFDKYIEEAKRTNKGESLLLADKINLKQGDEITLEMSANILDKDVYSIKTYDLDNSGKRITSGMSSKVYGKDLKKMLKAQSNKQIKESEYIYQEQ